MEPEERIDLLTDPAFDRRYSRDLACVMKLTEFPDFPQNLKISDDQMPDLDRWCSDEPVYQF